MFGRKEEKEEKEEKTKKTWTMMSLSGIKIGRVQNNSILIQHHRQCYPGLPVFLFSTQVLLFVLPSFFAFGLRLACLSGLFSIVCYFYAFLYLQDGREQRGKKK